MAGELDGRRVAIIATNGVEQAELLELEVREHRVVDIATQAGLSRATVDRVLHDRDGVRPETPTDRPVAARSTGSGSG